MGIRSRIVFIVSTFAVLAAVALHATEADAKLATPEGVTLQAKAGGRYLLYWDPIEADSLMGYSVWLRRKGEKEFVRLSVPVKVGKEIQKQSMVNEAKLELKLGEGRKDLEFAVVAEYEDGQSARSASVYSAKARSLATAAPIPASSTADVAAPAGVAVAVSTPAGSAPTKRDPYAGDDDKPQPKVAPWEHVSKLSKRPLLMPPGQWRSSLGLSFDLTRYMAKGSDPFRTTGLILSNSPYAQDQVVTWKRTDVRTRVRVPLRFKIGLLNGLEGWVEAAYHAEDMYIGEYNIDGSNYDYIRLVSFKPDGTMFYLSNPSSSNIGDTMGGLRLQPLDSLPLVLGGKVTLPTGISRLKSRIDRQNGAGSPAGTGDGVVRLALRVEYGWRGLRPGLSAFGEFSPGVTERFNYDSGGSINQYALTRGDLAQAGVGITIPWNVLDRDGAVVLEALGRSENASRYLVNGNDVSGGFTKIQANFLGAQTGIQFVRDDSLELAVDALQDLPGGFETGGRLAYRSGLLGDQLSLSGRLVY